jgi:uncharacterized protein
MFVEQITGLVIVWSIMLVGLIGSLIPAVPSTTLVLLGAILHKLYFAQASASWTVIIVLAIATAISLILDYAATMIGAKKLGATWRGILGSFIGCVVGALTPFNIIGMFIGTFLGALIFELMGGREFKDATKAGLGAVVGLLAGAVGKLAFSIAMIGAFSWSALANFSAPAVPDSSPPAASEPATNSVPLTNSAATNLAVELVE